MTTTITAAVVSALKGPFTIEKLQLDDIRPNEVRVRMVATGVCHTDAIVRDGVYPAQLPAVLGHDHTFATHCLLGDFQLPCQRLAHSPVLGFRAQ